MINKIAKVTIYVNNQDEAKKFWTEKLNFVADDKHMGPIRWLEVAPNEDEFTTFVLYDKNMMKSQNPNANVDHPSVILSTTDIEKAYSKMKANGVDVDDLVIMPYGKMFSFKDQDNNPYLLREDK